MLDMSKITIRHVNSAGIAYGEPIDHGDLTHVVSAVEDEIIETDEDRGEVTVGGQRYRWSRGS